MDWSAVGNYLGGALNTGAQLYGQQNASEAITKADLAAIGNQQKYLTANQQMYQPQQTLGNEAFSTLGSTLGVGGKPANYSNFLNMPGYQFAVQQGTQAIQRQAAAQGNGYTPNEAQAVGQYVTGTAMQDYNTYVNQLMGAAGFGAQANAAMGNIRYNTGANISQLMANTGEAEAGKYTGMGQTFAGGGGFGRYGGSGVNSAGGILGSIIGKGLNYLSGSGGGGAGPGWSSGTDASGGYYDAGGNYITPQQSVDMSAGNTPGDINTGYDNSQTDFSQSAGAYGGP